MALKKDFDAYMRNLFLNRVVTSAIVPSRLRWRLLRACGLSVSPALIYPGGFYGGRGIRIGENTFLNHRVFLDASGEITIGSGCRIGPEVMILTGSHETGNASQRGARNTASAVTVGDGTWIGARVIVQPGVRIGAGCVIAAGAVVVHDCLPNTFYAGVPAVSKLSLEAAELT